MDKFKLKLKLTFKSTIPLTISFCLVVTSIPSLCSQGFYIAIPGESEVGLSLLKVNFPGNKRRVIENTGILIAVDKTLEKKKQEDLANPPYVHFSYVSPAAVQKEMGLKGESSLSGYLRRNKINVEQFHMIRRAEILTKKDGPERLSWVTKEIKEEKRKRGIKPVTASVEEAAIVFRMSANSVRTFIRKNPAKDNYGFNLKPRVDHQKRDEKLMRIITDLLIKQEEVTIDDLVKPSGLSVSVLEKMSTKLYYWGVSARESIHKTRLLFEKRIKKLSEESKSALISLIFHLRDQDEISFSQAYALIHLIRYIGTPLGNNTKIKEILGVASEERVSIILNGLKGSKSKVSGALEVIADQPEIGKFVKNREPIHDAGSLRKLGLILVSRINQLPDLMPGVIEKERIDGKKRKKLNIHQKIKIIKEVLRCGKNKTLKQIGSELPQIVGDLSIKPMSSSAIHDFLFKTREHESRKGAISILNGALEALFILERNRINVRQLRTVVHVALEEGHITAGEFIMNISRKEGPEQIIMIMRKFEKKRTPLAQLVKIFKETYRGKRYAFGEFFTRFFSTAVELERDITDRQIIKEITRYFAYVVIFKQRDVPFVDAFFHMLHPKKRAYYFSETKVASFFADVYYELMNKRNTDFTEDGKLAWERAVKVWGKALAMYAHKGKKAGVRIGRKEFVRRTYKEFLRIIFPKIRFVSKEQIEASTFKMRRENILIGKDTYIDFDYIFEAVMKHEEKSILVGKRFFRFFEKTTPEAVAIKYNFALDDIDLINQLVMEAAWDYDPEKKVAEFNTFATAYIKNYRMSRYRRTDGIVHFAFDKDGKAITLEEKEDVSPDAVLPVRQLVKHEYIKSRLEKLNRALIKNFTIVEKTIFRLANGLHSEYPYPMEQKEIAQFLHVNNIVKGRKRPFTKARIQQILLAVTNNVIKILNEPTVEELQSWRDYVKDPLRAEELPPPLLVEVKDKRILLFDDMFLEDYDLKDGIPVFVSVVRSLSNVGHNKLTFVNLEVQYKDKIQGSSILWFDKSDKLIDMVKVEKSEEASRLFNQIILKAEGSTGKNEISGHEKDVQNSH